VYNWIIIICGDDPSSFSDKKQKTQPNRKYDIRYLKYGFVIKPETENKENLISLCVLWKEILSNQSMKLLL